MTRFQPSPPKPVEVTEEQYKDELYREFQSSLVYSCPLWRPTGKRVSFRRNPLVDGRHNIFWHAISGDGDTDAERQIDHNRCQHLALIRPMIDEFNRIWPQKSSPDIVWWESSRPPHWRHVISLPDFSYAVILEQRQEYTNLITAIYYERRRRRERQKREHEDYWRRKAEAARMLRTASDTPSTHGR